MKQIKISVGDTLKLKTKLKRKSSYTYNVFNGKKVIKIISVNSLEDAKRIDENMVSYFIMHGKFKVIVTDGMFGEQFVRYNSIEKYID